MLTFASYTRTESEKQDARNPRKKDLDKTKTGLPRKEVWAHGEHPWQSDTPAKAIALKTKNEHKHGNC